MSKFKYPISLLIYDKREKERERERESERESKRESKRERESGRELCQYTNY